MAIEPLTSRSGGAWNSRTTVCLAADFQACVCTVSASHLTARCRSQRTGASWSCGAGGARRTEIVTRSRFDTTLRADLSPAGIVFSAISKAIAEYARADVGAWLFTPDRLDLDGLPADAAWGLAADVVTITLDRRFVEQDRCYGWLTAPP